MRFVIALVLLVASVHPQFAAEPIISEFMPDNARVLADEDGEFTDWLEVHNPNGTPFDLAGYYLTDDPQHLAKWAFPSVPLPANGYLVVFASGKNRSSNPARLHTSFRLNANGGFLALVKPDGTNIVSAFSYPQIKEDVAYGIAQNHLTLALLDSSAPRILVPTNAAELPADWTAPAFSPGANWLTGAAPPGIGFDTNVPSGLPANVARTGTAVQSTILSTFGANLAIDGNLANFTHTVSADTVPFWQVTLTNEVAIHNIILHNRTSCCGSRLRDITIEILSTNATGTVTNYTSTLLNPENAGFTYPNGPPAITNDLVALTGAPVFGRIVRVRRTADPDLSGTGGQGNADEAAVLSLGEVTVNATGTSDYRPHIRTDLEFVMLGKNASAFVRLPFTVTNTFDLLTLRVRYDDGFIASLNGAEIARRNAPASPAWNSEATADRLSAQALLPETIDLSASIPMLADGANLLAVHILNSAATNADLLFQPELSAALVRMQSNVFLVDATPGARNETAWYFDEVADTSFSVDRGFFEAPFSLSITSTTPDATIYYSFNGDEPGPGKGILYTGPIMITNTTVLRARAFRDNWKATDIDTHTYIFIADVIHQAEDWPITRVPPPYFPSSWGVNSVDYGMDPQVVTNHTLAEWNEAFKQVATMSIVTEMKNLFDPAIGIYANATGHGAMWERPMSLELIDPANETPSRFQENCGLRIRGGFSRNPQFVKHSFRVFFRRNYGAGKLRYPLFENEGAQEFETFDLRTSQNYSWPRENSSGQQNLNGENETMVREVFCRETLGVMGQPYRRSRYYHLYINGQYWGLYETDERPEASYGETYFGGDKEDFDVVKCGNRGTQPNFATEATDGNLIAFSNLWTMTRSMVTNASNSNYFRILGRNPDGTRNPSLPVMLDVDNLIDYMLGIFYTGDGDATLSSFLANNMPNNWFGMRDRTNPDVGFRFFNSDCEHTLGAPRSEVDRTGPFPNSNQPNFTFANPQWMHEELMFNAEYRLRFADHVHRHFFNNGALTPEAGTNRFLRKAAQITKAMRAYSARWGDAVAHPPYGEDDWTNRINFIVTNWFPTRTAIVLEQLKVDRLYPSNAAAAVFNQLGGEVPAGFNLEMRHTNSSGAIFFTIDGSDPRALGGGVSPSAQSYSEPIVINTPTLVRARVLVGTNWSAIIEYTFFPPQDFSKLLITEIMYHPPSLGPTNSDEFEFLELKNAGPTPLNLSGLRFNAGLTFTFTNGTTLAPGAFAVLVRNPSAFAAKYPSVPIRGVYNGRLDNGGETLTLSHPLGSRVLSVSYDDLAPWPVTPDDFGFSLVPAEPNSNADPDNPANWRASTFIGGSPGADDPATTVPPILISEILSHSETGVDFIELFNPNSTNVDISGWFLTDDPQTPKKYRIVTGTFLAPSSYLVFDETDFNPTPGLGNSFSLNARGDDVYIFSGDANTNLTGYSHGFSFGAAADGDTFGRYVISTGDEHFPAQLEATPGQPNPGPRVGPVVISEIMYHPDVGDDEFVELKNITTNSVPLYDPANEPNTWRLSGLGYTFPANVILAPNEFLLLVATNPAAFRNKYSVPPNVAILGPYAGVLQDSGERLELQRPDVPDTNGFAYITVDEVRYNDKAPWPPAADGNGPSLQRKSNPAYGNDPANWEAAVATPGAEFIGGRSPVILAQPQNQSVLAGETVTLSVSADGAAPLNYQWHFDGNRISGATSSTLVLTNVQLAQAGSYSVVVFNNAGSAASAIAHLTVRQPPRILTQPANVGVRPGLNGTFSVNATGNGFLRYQWQFNGTNIAGATNATLVITNAQFSHEGLYAVFVTDNVATVRSVDARLVILVDPFIVQQPLSQTIVAGANVTLSLTVTNTATLPVGYRLRRNGITLQDTFLSLNQRSVFYTITNVQPGATNWALVVTNQARPGGLLSASAILFIIPDTDGDGIPDTWENQYGLNHTNAMDRTADADLDGMLNWQEYVAGTDPTNSSSYLRIDLTPPTVRFLAVLNKTYTVEYNNTLDPAAWSKLADVVAHRTNRTETLVDPAATPQRHYRLITPRQPR